MSIDDYKKSKKAYIKNHITPITKEILEAQRKMEEFQDELVQATLGEAPQYLQKPLSPKAIKSKKTSNVASTSSSITSEWNDGTYDFFKNVI